MHSLRPSQIRARILREHIALRSTLDRIAAQALQVSAGEAPPEQLLQLAQELYGELREHIDFEDALLVPALRDVDAWGAIRASELERHHREQRDSLRVLAVESTSQTPSALAVSVTGLIAELRADMSGEDCALLSSELLRDDLVALDASGG
jgi:iron-sulfur cluster repair protein YtfE (RIC family)